MKWEELTGIYENLGWVDQNDQRETVRVLVNSVRLLVGEIKSLHVRICELEPNEKV